jgi:2-methylcitrate dehydratase PrpD
LVTGYEIGARAGEAWRIPPGWHVDGSWHSLGVAAAVARLTSGPHAIQPAIEAAACQIPASLYLPIAAGSVLRNTYPAHAVLLAMLSAGAAAAGFDLPRDAFEEARRRVLRATDTASMTPVGQWTILAGYLKPFAGVRHTHYGVEAALRLRNRDISPERIDAIKLSTYQEAVQYCGNRAPRTAIQAQFSLSYAIAAALVLGDLGPNAYDDIDDPLITRLEQRVAVEADPARLRRGAQVTIEAGGESFADSVDDVGGDPATPILGERGAAALIRFFLEGNPDQPARACFTLAR